HKTSPACLAVSVKSVTLWLGADRQLDLLSLDLANQLHVRHAGLTARVAHMVHGLQCLMDLWPHDHLPLRSIETQPLHGLDQVFCCRGLRLFDSRENEHRLCHALRHISAGRLIETAKM